MIIEIKKIADLMPASYNPRKATKKQEDNLKKSLEKFGVVEPIVFNKQTGCIVGGHFRIRELKKLGYTEVECVIVDLPIEDEKELNIRLNANTGEWDWDLIETEWDTDTLIEWGLEIPEGDEPFGSETVEAKEDDFDTTPPAVAKTVIGDLYEIGEHRLLCADCTDVTAVDRLMGGERADLLLTDPPYGIDYGGMLKGKGDGKGGSDKNGWKSHGEPEWDKERVEKGVLEFFIQATENQIIWGGNYYTDQLPPTMGWLIWDKGQRDFSLADGEMAWTSFNNALRIKTYSRAAANQEEKHHATQKPIEIIKWCFEYADRHSKSEIKLALDPYLGSGTTMVTGHQLKRKVYGCEISPQYCDVIVKRILNLDSTLRVKRNGVDVTDEWRQEAVPIKLEATNK
jgi:DNA modification methylase